MTLDRLRRPALIACAVLLGAATAPAPARADGPGYGGRADALTVRWQTADRASGLAVYAVGFRGGSPVRVQVGAQAERSVAADASGAVDVRVGSALAAAAVTGPVSPGTSVLVAGRTPGGELRTLVGAVPPRSAVLGAADLVPWAAALAALGAAAFGFRRRFTTATQRYRHPARHRA